MACHRQPTSFIPCLICSFSLLVQSFGTDGATRFQGVSGNLPSSRGVKNLRLCRAEGRGRGTVLSAVTRTLKLSEGGQTQTSNCDAQCNAYTPLRSIQVFPDQFPGLSGEVSEFLIQGLFERKKGLFLVENSCFFEAEGSL